MLNLSIKIFCSDTIEIEIAHMAKSANAEQMSSAFALLAL